MPNNKKNVRYWSLVQDEGSREADIYIFGDITSFPWLESDVSSYGFVEQIRNVDADEIHVHINSYGGETAEALAIMNTLIRHPARVTTYVDGFACSAASIILMAGERRVAAGCSNILVHAASSAVAGNAAKMRAEADNLDTVTEQSVTAYVSRTGKSREEILTLMAEDRFMSPEEALEWGFVTEVQDLFDKDLPSQSVRQMISQRLTSGKTPAEQKPADAPAQKTVKTFLDALSAR